jgi:hypothetical protein
VWPDAPARTYSANGLHAQMCIVIPEWNMVITRTNCPRSGGARNSPGTIVATWNNFIAKVGDALGAPPPPKCDAMPKKTNVSIRGDAFYINGSPTYAGRSWQGRKVEGLLFNSRMVLGLFDDANPKTRDRWAYADVKHFEADRNLCEFVAAMPQWRRHGLLGFTLNLQGGKPSGSAGDQPCINSALTKTGELQPVYMLHLERILDRADELGMAVILGLFDSSQDKVLQDEAAVCHAVDNIAGWLLDRGYRNVLIEVNNESSGDYHHAILQPDRVHELIDRVKTRNRDGRRLLVSTSFGGGVIPPENVVQSADFLLLHGNSVADPVGIGEMVSKTRAVAGYRPVPIVFNEDDHYDFDKPRNNMLSALEAYASWGYFDGGESNYIDGYQAPPVNWGINTQRKRAFFAKVGEITASPEAF